MIGKIKGVIVDLDGVLVSTDEYHYRAWKKIAARENIFFNEQINQRLRGVSRMESLNIMLEKATRTYTEEDKLKLADEKNHIYVESIKSLNESDLLKGAREYLAFLKENSVLMAVASASKNAFTILEKLRIKELFDFICDGNMIKKSKPDPEVFLTAAEGLGLRPESCLVIEDSAAGIIAAKTGGFVTLAVGAIAEEKIADYNAKGLFDPVCRKAVIDNG